MRTNLTKEGYEKFLEETRKMFKARMLDYYISRKAVVEGVKRRIPLEDIEEDSVDCQNELKGIAYYGMLLIEPSLFFEIDRKIFQISPNASEYQYDAEGNVWIGFDFHGGIVPPVPLENSYVIKED